MGGPEGTATASEVKAVKSASWKRLIVLCDGTWKNSLDDNPTFPTNVTRISRALSPYAVVKDKNGVEREVEQIIYYQPGVGTGEGDKLRGGAYGLGVSANVRAAYGFLAHNYDPEPGDEIIFFGFSRGAYTARSIAGLVTKLGLLTKRGMDHFPEVMEEFYKDPAHKPDFEFSPALLKKIGKDVHEEAKDAIRIVGVWDTVGFHAEGFGGEKIEFHNAELSPRVGYAYHALALDERRKAYQPTLWQWPKGYATKNDGTGLQVMRQVWFSGFHSDIGGGRYDPRLSNIALAWMVAQCAEDRKLAFIDEDAGRGPDENYLLTNNGPNTPGPWGTALGKGEEGPSAGLWEWIKNGISSVFSADRRPLQTERTYERIHRSIRDRDLRKWPCGPLSGGAQGPSWAVKVGGEGGNALTEADADAVADGIEERYRGRIRAAPKQKGSV